MQNDYEVQAQRTFGEACRDFAFALVRCLLRFGFVLTRNAFRLSMRMVDLASRRLGRSVLKAFVER
jgi:hypothetical protein